MKICIKAPAKINLSLDVLSKREDGFHEVEMIMTTVDLADRIELKLLKEDKITVEVSEGFVPSDSRNIAYQAAQLLKERFKVNLGVEIYIQKNIPVSAGLAGGSSDAAATLRGLNQLWDLNLTIDELAILGAEIGSDVSFCVYGGTALATGRGEKIRHISAPPPCWVILAKPKMGVSTGEIYRNLKLNDLSHPSIKQMTSAIEQRNYPMICENLGNVLETVTFNLYPEVSRIKEQMIRFGADGVLMSGSGPTVFGLVKHESRMLRIYNGLRGFCDDVHAVRLMGERYY
ncbi:4-(cytidine 5'-diphospho)-2-C-methyl-D-erythritol kinase [Bacillaceae bacterium IKA-2]|nr:4-(cytidine 5'-diphospho)-2-C-methyl-D-erythritol kinase [Bacillaceae bacterium IKA-2]